MGHCTSSTPGLLLGGGFAKTRRGRTKTLARVGWHRCQRCPYDDDQLLRYHPRIPRKCEKLGSIKQLGAATHEGLRQICANMPIMDKRNFLLPNWASGGQGQPKMTDTTCLCPGGLRPVRVRTHATRKALRARLHTQGFNGHSRPMLTVREIELSIFGLKNGFIPGSSRNQPMV